LKRGCSKLKAKVQDQIEELRLQMQKIASDKALTDPRVVGASEKLDVLINEFYLDPRKKQ
jgi:Spo0E like sporulation regulatory protein.